jgi:hypothetical protein
MSTRTLTTTLIRRAVLAALGLGGLLVATASAEAQDEVLSTRGASSKFELRPYVGAYVPTGDHRDLLKDAVLVGAQASWRAMSRVAVTGTFGWAPSKDRVQPGDETLDVYQYDIGAEARPPSWFNSGSWDFTPFVGLGIGGRTYNYRDLDNVDAKTNIAGYGALGGEVGFGRAGLRLEARDYVSRFEPLIGGGDAKTRNDVTLAAGLTVRF